MLKRIRWIGYYPKPGDVYNFKVQSFIADLMNIRMIELGQRLPKRVRFVAQIHDALVIEAPVGARSALTQSLVKELWAEEIYIPESDRRMVMPAPIKVAERVSDFR